MVIQGSGARRASTRVPLSASDGHEDPLAVADRSTEHHEALVGERVHERRVSVPVVLLPPLTRAVPARPALLGDDEVGH